MVCVYMVEQLHALSAQQNKHLLSVEFSKREHWPELKQITCNGKLSML